MGSSAENKTCAICLRAQATLTGPCSHSVHLGCLLAKNNAYTCPTCHIKWDDLPNPNTSNDKSSSANDTNYYSARHYYYSRAATPVSVREPSLDFSDDEPLTTSFGRTTAAGERRRVEIRAVPELNGVPASQSHSHFSVLVGLEAPSSPEGLLLDHAPIDLVMVLDISGSMLGPKLALLKRAVGFVVDNLGPRDRLAVVSFSSAARLDLPLRRMTEPGRIDARRAVGSLRADGRTNVVVGLHAGVGVLESRGRLNPVASIMFLSDGRDNCNRAPYLHLLPESIYPNTHDNEEGSPARTIPVHAFGLGSDHDPRAMHAVSDASGGTFSFVESHEAVQEAFAGCIGGLLTVVAQRLQLVVRSASRGVEIRLICSGRYASEISDERSLGRIDIGDLYAGEEKEFLIYVSVPKLQSEADEEREKVAPTTPLLHVACTYKDAISRETVQAEAETVAIKRPVSLSPSEAVINPAVDRQRNRLEASETIAEALRAAESGNLSAARSLLSDGRRAILSSRCSRAGDPLSLGLEAEMRMIEKKMANLRIYEESGRAYVLSSMSSDGYQRATTRGGQVVPSAESQGSRWASAGPHSYVTSHMAAMVHKSMNG